MLILSRFCLCLPSAFRDTLLTRKYHPSVNDGTRNIKRGNSRWYALNIRSELDQPGEYYIHRNATNRESAHGMVYFIPPGGVGAPALPAFVSANASVLELQPGAANLRFEGLQIAYSQRTTIVGERVSNISVVNCTIFGAGGGGANLTGDGNRLLQNEISGGRGRRLSSPCLPCAALWNIPP